MAYNYLSFVSKATLTIVIWAGVIGRADDVVVRSSNDESDGPDDSEIDTGLWVSFGAVFLFNIMLGGIMFWDYRRLQQTQFSSLAQKTNSYAGIRRRRVQKFIFAWVWEGFKLVKFSNFDINCVFTAFDCCDNLKLIYFMYKNDKLPEKVLYLHVLQSFWKKITFSTALDKKYDVIITPHSKII